MVGWIGIGVACFLVLGLIGSLSGKGGKPTADATTQATTATTAQPSAADAEAAFLTTARTLELGNKDLAGASNADLLGVGSSICDALQDATTTAEVDLVIGGLVNSSAHPTVEQAQTFVYTAATYLCPEHQSLTDQAVAEATTPPATAKPKPAPAPEFGEGTYKVGVDIKPGLYKATVTSGMGYWARLADPDGNNILANDVKTSGTMYLRVRPTDKYIEISGTTFRKVG